MKNVRAAVFASGSGTNFQAIIERTDLPCEVSLLICDKPGAPVIEKAKHAGVSVLSFNPKNYQSKSEYEEWLVDQLQAYEIDWIFLAGYMRLIGSTLLHAYEGRIINIHPSLLPKFPGLDAIGQALENKASVTGVTIHYVDEGMDTGPVIAQESISIYPNESRDSLTERIQNIEHELYPEVIKQLIKQSKREVRG